MLQFSALFNKVFAVRILRSLALSKLNIQLPVLEIKMSKRKVHFRACKRKDDPQSQPEHSPAPKKPRLVFTDLQRRTLQAIFKETKRPSKEMQVTIARQLGLEPTTVGNFFMNARRRSMDKWKDEEPSKTTVVPVAHDGQQHSPGTAMSGHSQPLQQQQPDIL